MLTTILLAIVAAVAGGFLYTIVGIIPGTDETATMVPTTIILVLAGAPAGVLFAWEVGIIVAMQCSPGAELHHCQALGRAAYGHA